MDADMSNIKCPSCGAIPDVWDCVTYESVTIRAEEGGLDIDNFENDPYEGGYICPLCGAKSSYDDLEEQTEA